eukprot:21455-Amorphochlora_amoeboformis.AAC.1
MCIRDSYSTGLRLRLALGLISGSWSIFTDRCGSLPETGADLWLELALGSGLGSGLASDYSACLSPRIIGSSTDWGYSAIWDIGRSCCWGFWG